MVKACRRQATAGECQRSILYNPPCPPNKSDRHDIQM